MAKKRAYQLTFVEPESRSTGQTGPRLHMHRLSLLGKPIQLSHQRCHASRNSASMRWKMRLRAFLERPQGLLPWLYHLSL